MPVLRLALAQTNSRLGDFAANRNAILVDVQRSFESGADLVAFPEMALTGYPIEDLARRPDFLRRSREQLDVLAANMKAAGYGSVPVIVGFPSGPVVAPSAHGNPHAIAHNSAAVIQDGRVIGVYHKRHLPNYSVFDEYRNFVPGSSTAVIHVAGVDVGLAICEDAWQENGPFDDLATLAPGLVVVINGSPFERDKDDVRLPLIAKRAQEVNAHVAYVNLVGGQDDLVFDGDSFIVSPGGLIVARAPRFAPHLLITDLNVPEAHLERRGRVSNLSLIETATRAHSHVPLPGVTLSEPHPDSREQVWNALTLGLRDYVNKNGFPSVILGLSGGIDSAVCAAIAVDALGADMVFGVSMPSQWSSDHSRSDADDLAERLGIDIRTEAIADMVSPVEEQLHLDGVAAENLQARVRGIILMGLSNAEGHLVLSTGNKTEIAVGYSTIYGDSVGGFAPLKDVPKMLVWDLARWRNQQAQDAGLVEPIPENSIIKPPSAELRPGQVDQDSLPPYEILDDILDAYITKRLSRSQVVQLGFDPETVDRVIGLVDRAEWKRRQSAIGPKISEMAFGRDRRLPITSRA
jgi:NAD+ synthase (glutamine-hydrolysing)